MADRIRIRPAREFAADLLSGVMDRAFSDYIAGHEEMTPEVFAHFLWKEGIHLAASCVALIDDHPLGIAMMARRGPRSRLAAMAVEPDGRRRGLGATMLDAILEDEARRGQCEMVLECFEENHPAIALYNSRGFEVTQRLYGYSGGSLPAGDTDGLEAVDPVRVAAVMMAHGGPELSWQTSAPALFHYAPPDMAFRRGAAWAIVTLPDDTRLTLRALVVETEHRGRGQATRMLSALAARYPEREWNTIQVCPEGVGRTFFERRGFERDSLHQVEMRCPLGGHPS